MGQMSGPEREPVEQLVPPPDYELTCVETPEPEWANSSIASRP